jgi:eukaryotic-like serine/threonine-protein kinase
VTPERWERVKELFERTVALDGASREAFLRDSCDDPELRREVASLVESHERAGSFIQGSALERAPALAVLDGVDVPQGALLGAYRVGGVVGRGGMGAVYRAVRADDQYEKEVAVKIVRRGMDTEFVLARFRGERRILARLDHPGIARLLDAGTAPDGRPFFVMEYVQGRPIDRYAADQGLDVRRRLELFREVCAAVQYAHRSLVVHRDLKPSNVLVTAEGTPKLLDFGIAKLLDPGTDAEATATALRLMTTEHASPEQIKGEAITTATDVYSLGVMLYILLAGRHPQGALPLSRTEMARAICEEEPAPPSAAAGDAGLRRALLGDLDTIVLMALRKEPERRYASVEQLSEDVRRYLEGRPIAARKASFRYRAGKAVRRHRWGVATSLLLVSSLVAGLLGMAWQARRAEAERARAERRFQDVRRLANAFLFDFHDAIRDLSGATPARRLVVKTALQYLDSLAAESGADEGLRRELAAAYERVGDVQGRPSRPNLGDVGGALQSYRRALALREALPPDAAGAPELEQAETHARIGEVLVRSGRLKEALEHYGLAHSLAENALPRAAAPAEAELRWAAIQTQAAEAQARGGDPRAATERLDRLTRRLQARSDAPAQVAASVAHTNRGMILMQNGEPARARESFAEGLRLVQAAAATEPTSGEARRRVAVALQSMADGLLYLGHGKEAIERYEVARRTFEALRAEDPANARARRDTANIHNRLAQAFRVLDWRDPRAVTHWEEAIALGQELAEGDPSNHELQRDLRLAYSGLGHSHLNRPSRSLALEAYERACEIARSLAARDRDNVQLQQDLMATLVDLGKAQELLGRVAPAITNYRGALEIGQALAGRDRGNRSIRLDLSFAHGRLGDALRKSGDFGGAVEAYERARADLAGLLEAEPGSTSTLQEFVAQWDTRLGDAEWDMAQASSEGRAGAHRLRACARYRGALETFETIQRERPLGSAMAGYPAHLARAVARCAPLRAS